MKRKNAYCQPDGGSASRSLTGSAPHACLVGLLAWLVVAGSVPTTASAAAESTPAGGSLPVVVTGQTAYLLVAKTPSPAGNAGGECLTNLTLAMVLRIAERGNRPLERLRNAMERAALQMAIASSDVFAPKLTSSYSDSKISDTKNGTAAVTLDCLAGMTIKPYASVDYDETAERRYASEYGITVSRPLLSIYEHVRQRLPISRADKQILAAANEFSQARRELELAVNQAYYAVQKTKTRLRVRETRVQNGEEFLAATKRRVANGFAAPVDLVNATINLSQAKADRLSEQSALQDALDSLREILGQEMGNQIDVEPFDAVALIDVDSDLERDASEVLYRHESLINRRLGIDLAEKEILVQRDQGRPQLGLSLTAAETAAGDTPFEDTTGAETSDFRVTVTLSTTLDLQRSGRARVKQMEREQMDRRSELKDAEVALLKRLREAWRQVAQFQAGIGLAETRFAAEQDKLKATESRYERGNVDNLEVTRAQQTVDDAEIALLEAKVNLRIAIARYRSLLPARGVKPVR